MFEVRDIFMEDEIEYLKTENFLKSFNLKVPENIDYTIGIYKDNELVALGSLGEGIIKGVAIKEEYQERGLLSKILTELIRRAIDYGEDNLFVFTNPKTIKTFERLGFSKISESLPDAVLLEWGNGLSNFIKNLEKYKVDKEMVGSVVINANPFTKGHRYLVEKALEKLDFLYIFVVEENKSEFPFEVRYKLVEEGLKDLKNVKIIPTSRYAVSSATFPSYFTEEEKLAQVQAGLDIGLFYNYIAKTLNIKKRFIGEEPYSYVTNIYNKEMKKILPKKDIEVEEIERLKLENDVISATKVRKEIEEGNLDKVKKLVPISTYEFLVSEEGKKIIDVINREDKYEFK